MGVHMMVWRDELAQLEMPSPVALAPAAVNVRATSSSCGHLQTPFYT